LSRLEAVYALADGLDDSGAFMAEDCRAHRAPVAVRAMHVGVADAAGKHPDLDLPAPWCIELEIHDLQWSTHGMQDGGAHRYSEDTA
jgi:hypothetical protein